MPDQPVVTVPPTAPPPPALWNPNAAGLWSLLFTPTFGAWLHLKNWQALGDERMARQALYWACGNVALIVVFTLVALALPESHLVETINRGASIGVLVAWWQLGGRVQSHLVSTRYGKAYARRGWGAPLGYAMLVILGLLLLAFVVTFFGELGGAASSSSSGSPHM